LFIKEHLMNITLVLVAGRVNARFFKAVGLEGALEEVETISHPEGRLHEHELKADRPGRTFERVGDVRHAKEPPVSAKDHEALMFAGKIADRLEMFCREMPVTNVVLIAGPEFLGMLRDKLGSQAGPLVRLEVDKNIATLSPEEIRTYLPERLSFSS
jgi:protein required for attachment to host cells